jgi:hypothetical protein
MAAPTLTTDQAGNAFWAREPNGVFGAISTTVTLAFPAWVGAGPTTAAGQARTL